MPKKCEGFSFEEHQKKGDELYQACRTLQTLCLDISKAYGKTAPIAQLSSKAQKAAEELRNQLDNLVCRENTERLDMEVNGCYYGKNR
jgi:FtsZ-binding cell division protein ZapB